MAAKLGRPSLYNAKMAARILQLVASTTNGLETICLRNNDLPDAKTIRRWILEKKDFRDSYARAKEEQADLIADEIMEIADKVARGKGTTHEKINAARLRIDSRKWVAAKLKPKKYGEKIDHTTKGEKMDVQPIIFLSAEKLSDEQIEKYMKQNDRADNESV